MSILKIKDSQGNWVGVPTVKGDTGNGIQSAVLNDDYTLTLTFTDGTTYTTPPIRGEKGERGEPATDMEIHICSGSEYDAETRTPTIQNPNDKTFYLVPTEDGTSPDLFTEWVYVNGAWEMFGSMKIDLSGYLTDVTVGGTSVTSDGIANIPLASTSNAGAIQIGTGLTTYNNRLIINPATQALIKAGSETNMSVTPYRQHESTFYGLAKASGTDEKGSTLPVGQYTDEAKSSIQDMLDVPSNADLDEVEEKVEQNTEDLLKAFPVETASGNIASFEDGANDIPLQSLVVDIEPVQDTSSGDPSPENICPISGWEGMQIQHDGKNLFDKTVFADYANWSDSVTTSGFPTNYDNRGCLLPNLPIGTYTISFDWTTDFPTYLYLCKVDSVGFGTNVAYLTTESIVNRTYTFTIAEGERYFLRLGNTRNESLFNEKLAKFGNCQVEYGSTATPYEPYTGRTTPISWQTEAGTVYGGKLDVLSGVLRVIKKCDNVSDYNWSLTSGTTNVFRASISYKEKDNANVISSDYGTVSASTLVANMPDGTIKGNINYREYIYIKDSRYTTGEEFKEACGDVQICYDLFEPIEIQLTPHEVNSLLGVNNIFANVGDTYVEYRADPDLYIQRKMPEVLVDDVQINGTSIVADGVANVPIATNNAVGVTRPNTDRGLQMVGNSIGIIQTTSGVYKTGINGYYAVTIGHQHESTFYGLAKSAGDTTQSQSSNAVGQYTDNAKDSIQNMLGITPLIASHETDPFESAHVIGELFIIGGKLYRAKTALTAGEYVNEGTNVEVVNVAGVLDSKVGDIQINGSSIVTDGVANIPHATDSTYGVIHTSSSYGTSILDGTLSLVKADDAQVKAGTTTRKPIVPINQHSAVFYGLAKAAGHDEKNSTFEVGTYTSEAKSAIKQMLSIADNYDSFIVDVEGTDPTITGQPSYRYNCGEVLSLTVTPPETGTIDFRFTSGSSPTVLTLPSTVKMPEWWVEVEANTIYEMCITDGVYCGVMSWAM